MPAAHLTDPTVLVTLTGADQSGVSTRLFEHLSAFEIEVIDVEQLIVRGRLVLSALVTVPGDIATFEQTMRTVGEEFGLDVELEQGVG
ncbi:MAG: ACT domain-containing protein, partial [Actinomycetes bacterium]